MQILLILMGLIIAVPVYAMELEIKLVNPPKNLINCSAKTMAVTETKDQYTVNPIYNCDIRLANSIQTNEQFYDVYKVLQDADENDRILIQGDGYGGSASVTKNLMNAIKSSKAEITIQINSEAYSGHGYLLTSADHLIVNNTSLILFHRSSAYKEYVKGCKENFANKTDRGMSAEKKCLRLYKAEEQQENIFLKQTLGAILTKDEFSGLLNGADIILSGAEFNKRMSK